MKIARKINKIKQNTNVLLFLAAALFSAILLVLTSPLYKSQSDIKFSFHCVQNQPIEYQVFYTEKAGEHFNEKQSVKKIIPAGQHKVKITIPATKITSFRFDTGKNPGIIQISEMMLKGNKKIKLAKDDFRFVHINNIQEKDDGTIIITSTHADPLLVYKKNINLKGRIKIDWCLFAILTTFFVFSLYKLLSFLAKFKTIEKESRFDLFFLTLFFALSCIPILKINEGAFSTYEKRPLAAKPILWQQGINAKYGTQFEKWISDRFFLRDFFVDLHHKLNRLIAPNKGNEKVIVGTNDFWFYNDKIGPLGYANYYNYPEAQIEKGIKYIKDINEWCKENNKLFYYFIVPDKNKIYGEYFRTVNKTKDDSYGIGSVFINKLTSNYDIRAWYLKEDLEQHKNEGWLYWKKDTHWSALGAYLGYLRLTKEMEKDLDMDFLHINEWKDGTTKARDLLNMYHDSNSDTTIYKMPTLTKQVKCQNYQAYKSIQGIIKCSNPDGKYRVFIIRDSMFFGIIPYLAPNFAYVEMHWKTNITKEDLLNIKKNFDIVIFENVERNTRALFNSKFPKE